MDEPGLNEMSSLNNELVNIQRRLVQQNAEINRLNRQLQETNTELEQFTYVASHDLKEPLRMINAFMGLLKKKYGKHLDEKANSYIDFAIDGGQRMQALIKDLLDLSRIGRLDARKENTDLNGIVKQAVHNINQAIEDSKAEIIIDYNLPVMKVSPTDITRLFQNLIANAIKFVTPGVKPVVTITAQRQGETWLFTIKDNGIGIDVTQAKHIFEMFKRLHGMDAYPGTGIGLAICKKIVENHGGSIWVEPNEPGGSCFCFILPRTHETNFEEIISPQ